MISIKNLSFSYTNSAPFILDNINLVINKGSYVSIIGENGSAKSTLIKLILKILTPNSGTIELESLNIGYVPQHVEGFNSKFPITVNEMLKCHLKTLKNKTSDLLDKSLICVGMLEYKNSLIGNLSGGQQQKIFIARALMGNPELIVLDEPSTGVDIQSQDEIYSFIKKLNLENDMTVIAVEHNLKAALKYSTHIFSLEKRNGSMFKIADYMELVKRGI
jgi:zinc transport system ATP-binding protein